MFRNFFYLILLSISLFAFPKQSVLSIEEAFKYDVVLQNAMINVKLDLGENIYLYDEQLKLTLKTPQEHDIKSLLKLPKSKEYMEYMVYFDDIDRNISIQEIKDKLISEAFTITLDFQGCSKQGICYAPISKEYKFTLPIEKSVAPNVEVADTKTQELFVNEQDQIASMLKDSNLFLTLASFFGFGLLLSLTPCIFPMIPILSSILVAQGEKVSVKRGFFISLVYVLSMSIAYTIAGVFAGLFGANIQVMLQNPWVIGLFSLVFVALAFSMFGYYDLELPQSLQTKLTKKSDEARGKGGMFGVAIMGFLSALIVGPCVAAPLAGALIYIGQTGDALLGAMALFTLSLGMGVPLLLIGIGAGKFMPRPGGWMDSVKSFFGVALLALAILMLSRIVSIQIVMILLCFLLFGSSFYIGFSENLHWIKRTIASVLLIYALALFIGLLGGSTNLLKPLEVFTSSNSVVSQKQDSKVIFEKVKTLEELNSLIQTSSKPIFVDFYADWCTSCVELEVTTFKDKEVQKALEEFLTIKVDVTKNSKADKELLSHFNLFGPPALLFFSDKKEIQEARLIGYIDAKEFTKHLNKIAKVSK